MGCSNIPSFNEGEYCCAGNISMAKLNSASTYTQPRAQFCDLSLPLFMAWPHHSRVEPMAGNKARGPVLPSGMLKQICLLDRLLRYCWRCSWTSLLVGYQNRLKNMFGFFLTLCLSKPSRKYFQSNIQIKLKGEDRKPQTFFFGFNKFDYPFMLMIKY